MKVKLVLICNEDVDVIIDKLKLLIDAKQTTKSQLSIKIIYWYVRAKMLPGLM